jgi:hypothetical protein
MARNHRRAAHQVTSAELQMLEGIFAAYMQCNRAGSRTWHEVSPDLSSLDFAPTAMGYLSAAGRAAWTQLGLPERLWSTMVESGEGAAYVLNLYRNAEI